MDAATRVSYHLVTLSPETPHSSRVWLRRGCRHPPVHRMRRGTCFVILCVEVLLVVLRVEATLFKLFVLFFFLVFMCDSTYLFQLCICRQDKFCLLCFISVSSHRGQSLEAIQLGTMTLDGSTTSCRKVCDFGYSNVLCPINLLGSL